MVRTFNLLLINTSMIRKGKGNLGSQIQSIVRSAREIFYGFSKMNPISDLRTDYNPRTNLLLEKDLEKLEPFYLFDKWFKEALNNPKIPEPNAMCLATSTKDGVPSARFVLCKDYDKNGFVFFTHYTSRKGQEMEENPNIALTFYWHDLHKSVRIEGKVEKVAKDVSDKYFHSRPYDSQIGALCSNQSKPIEGRHILAQKEQNLKSTYPPGAVPRPEHWGGYLCKPHRIEFWQGQSDRIHDRIVFRMPKDGDVIGGKLLHAGEDGWVYERLAP